MAARGISTVGDRPIRFRGESYYRDDEDRVFRKVEDPEFAVPFNSYEGRLLQMRSSGHPIVLGISGRGSFDGDLEISLEGAEELMPLLRSRGIASQALSAFNSTSGTQRISGSIRGAKVDLTVTHPGPDRYHVKGDLGYHVDRTFTKQELIDFYNKAKEMF
jgi:hypothetical protein